MIDNPTFATDLAPLIAQLSAGTITQASFATSVSGLLDSWSVQSSAGALSSQVTGLTAAIQTLLTQFNAIGIKGVVATVAALPEGAANGDAYIVSATNHGYAKINGNWIDLGAMQGPQGDTGASGTVGLGPVTTGEAGSSAEVTNSGTPSAAILNFTIPKGDTGAAATVAVSSVTTGAAGTSAEVTNGGTSGAAQLNFTIPRGATGAAATVAVGTVTTGAAGSTAAVVNGGTTSAAQLNFTIPKGDTGTAATIAVGTVATGAAGSSAEVINGGTSVAAELNFTIPKGDTGAAATVAVGIVTTGAAGSSAEVTNAGTSGAAELNFTIPKGDTGAAATVAVGTVTTGALGSSASIVNSGTDGAAVLDFAIPVGETGETGAAATVTVGTVTTGAAGSSAEVTNAGTSADAILDFSIPTGETGPAAWTPPAPWATDTAYVVGPPASVVTQGGSAYVCLVPHTSGTFATDLGAGKWELVAQAGSDGTGAGNVNSSGTIVAGRLASFGDTTGDVLVDSGFAPAAFEQAANKGAANGYAPLDATSKVSVSYLPAAVLGANQYQGTWNAATNTPTLASGTGTKGYWYKVATVGTTTLDGNASWSVNDQVIFDGSTWDKIDGAPTEVGSVAGLVGAITASGLKTALAIAAGDVSGLGTAATKTVGTAANNVVALDSSARLPAVDGSQLTGVAPTSGSIAAALGYTPVNPSTLGTAATKTVGTAANDVVALDGSGKLPAVDGSKLLNLPISDSVPDSSSISFALVVAFSAS